MGWGGEGGVIVVCRLQVRLSIDLAVDAGDAAHKLEGTTGRGAGSSLPLGPTHAEHHQEPHRCPPPHQRLDARGAERDGL